MIEKNLDKLKNTYLKKEYDEPNTIFILLNKEKDIFIFKKIDTITLEEDIVAIPQSIVVSKYYTGFEFIKKATYVGKSGFYKFMNPLEKTIYINYVLYYKDEFYELVFDTFDNRMKIIPSIYSLEYFVNVDTVKSKGTHTRKI